MSRMMEQLESRRMLSVSVQESCDGVLHIHATGGTDAIDVSQATRGGVVVVLDNGVVTGTGNVPDPSNPGQFLAGEYANVKLIVIDADSSTAGAGYNIATSTYISSIITTGAGDDVLNINDLSDLGSVINVNGGSDGVVVTHNINPFTQEQFGFTGIDVINGGAGNDGIAVVGSGTSIINGGTGDDQIVVAGVTGFTSYAMINGGTGNDFVSVTGTVDRQAYAFVNGGRGTDTLLTQYATVYAVNVEITA